MNFRISMNREFSNQKNVGTLTAMGLMLQSWGRELPTLTLKVISRSKNRTALFYEVSIHKISYCGSVIQNYDENVPTQARNCLFAFQCNEDIEIMLLVEVNC